MRFNTEKHYLTKFNNPNSHEDYIFISHPNINGEINLFKLLSLEKNSEQNLKNFQN